MPRSQQHYGEGIREWRSDEERSNRWRDENEGRYGSAADDRDVAGDYKFMRHDDGPVGDYRAGGRQGGYGGNYGEGRYGEGGSLSDFELAGRQSHRGKGPANYQRSDERLREMLCERLQDHPDIDASDITVTVTDGIVLLEGTVGSRRARDLVEDVAEELSVLDVRSSLRVVHGE